MSLIFDSHAHYDDEQFDSDRDTVLDSQFSGNVGFILNCASDLASAEKSIELCKKYKNMYVAVGIHPHEAEDAPTDYIDRIKNLLEYEKAVAVGEIGLDYHYDLSPRDVQKQVLTQQIKLAKELDLPVIIHDREAHGDMYPILQEYKPKGVVHCYSGSVELMREAIKIGMYIGLGGAVTFKNSKTPKEVAKEVPIDRLLLETDAPYMAPVPMRGKRCTSDMISYTAEEIARIREMSVDELISITDQNAKELFGIK